MLKTDCIYFNYEEDMGKSIPYCKVKKHECTPCMCDTENNYIDNCDDCDRYVRKNYDFLESVIKGGREWVVERNIRQKLVSLSEIAV